MLRVWLVPHVWICESFSVLSTSLSDINSKCDMFALRCLRKPWHSGGVKCLLKGFSHQAIGICIGSCIFCKCSEQWTFFPQMAQNYHCSLKWYWIHTSIIIIVQFFFYLAFIDRAAERGDRKWDERVGGRHAVKGHRLDMNPGLLQRGQSLCTRDALSPNLANRCPDSFIFFTSVVLSAVP